jgi:hypothetical protein
LSTNRNNAVGCDNFRPHIPDFVPKNVKELIEDRWATNTADRPTFGQIVFRLEQMQFKLTAGVNSTKVAALVNQIEEWESKSHSETRKPDKTQ